MDREGKDGFMIDTPPTIWQEWSFGHERIAYEIRRVLDERDGLVSC